MGWFNKKEEPKKRDVLPSLPELPKLPELPRLPDDLEKNSFGDIHKLPSFPNNSLGDKFSQNIIKDAVTGKEEGDNEEEADEFAEDEMQTMPAPPQAMNENFHFPRTEMPEPKEKIRYRARSMTAEAEPIFVRLDKFEDSLEIFEKTKEKISEINDMLDEVKKLKEDEEKELASWEREMQIVKEQIEKIDRELFSKL